MTSSLTQDSLMAELVAAYEKEYNLVDTAKLVFSCVWGKLHKKKNWKCFTKWMWTDLQSIVKHI
ncbi:hypothetical protein MNBD_BACTEROID06-701 [hydrothermal vent metagenome]|uniref:Uncharacterized protein n=1 Tax=hydrothermal vent metagenome TaxID=652676 RepID=A0A3B0V7Q0_9ZZZZ